MGNAQSNQPTGNVSSDKTAYGNVSSGNVSSNCTTCERSVYGEKCTPCSQKKEGFLSAGLGPTDGFKMPNWVLPMLYIAIIILIFAAIIAAIYLNNK